MKKVSPARLPQQAFDGFYSSGAGLELPRVKPYLIDREKTVGTVHLHETCSTEACRNDSGPIMGEASRLIGPDIFSKGRNDEEGVAGSPATTSL